MKCIFYPMMVALAFVLLITGTHHVRISSWRRLVDQDAVVSGYEVWVRGRSKVECIRECNKYSHCTSFFFNVSSRTCYLQPALDNTTHTAHLGQVYVNTDAACDENLAPSVNGSVSWNHTLTSLRGDVECYDDFIKSVADVTIRCLVNGSWEVEGGCLQHVWRNPSPMVFPVAIPAAVDVGWTVCVEGVPTAPVRFTVDLLTRSGDMAVHADFRFRFAGTTDAMYLAYKLNGTFFGGQEFRPFRFYVGFNFFLEIYVTTVYFKVAVNRILYASFPIHGSLPPADVTAVDVRNDVNVTRLDVMCNV